jgi:L-serine dehydratase
MFFIDHLKKHYDLNEVVEISTYLYGSLAKTGMGHGTDIAIMLGLMGENYTTIDTNSIGDKIERISMNQSLIISSEHTIPFIYENHINFKFDENLDYHPNGMKFEAMLADNTVISREYYSVGGGFIVDQAADLKADASIKTKYPCHNAREILDNCQRLNIKVSDLVLINESAWRSEEEIREQALYIWNEIKNCVFRGIKNTGTLPGGLNVKRRARDMSLSLMPERRFDTVDEWIEAIKQGPKDFSTINKWIAVFALAVSEENAAYGRIVTAPTNGASGVIPAVMMYAYCFCHEFTEEQIIRFILTAGEIGTLYKKGATISGAMGGCQAEIGVSSSMAAGGLAETLGASNEEVLQAAEIAMEHHLGMTCDPIGGLVQIPCIERNIMGAIKAITASNVALESDTSAALLSLDDVIKTMLETAADMNSKYKETSEGGLARIPVNIVEC